MNNNIRSPVSYIYCIKCGIYFGINVLCCTVRHANCDRASVTSDEEKHNVDISAELHHTWSCQMGPVPSFCVEYLDTCQLLQWNCECNGYPVNPEVVTLCDSPEINESFIVQLLQEVDAIWRIWCQDYFKMMYSLTKLLQKTYGKVKLLNDL